ncbi:MAG: hypothetical protein AAGH78_08825 [Cyanobacteria bacterium P01_H01_bin.58]
MSLSGYRDFTIAHPVLPVTQCAGQLQGCRLPNVTNGVLAWGNTIGQKAGGDRH